MKYRKKMHIFTIQVHTWNELKICTIACLKAYPSVDTSGYPLPQSMRFRRTFWAGNRVLVAGKVMRYRRVCRITGMHYSRDDCIHHGIAVLLLRGLKLTFARRPNYLTNCQQRKPTKLTLIVKRQSYCSHESTGSTCAPPWHLVG